MVAEKSGIIGCRRDSEAGQREGIPASGRLRECGNSMSTCYSPEPEDLIMAQINKHFRLVSDITPYLLLSVLLPAPQVLLGGQLPYIPA